MGPCPFIFVRSCHIDTSWEHSDIPHHVPEDHDEEDGRDDCDVPEVGRSLAHPDVRSENTHPEPPSSAHPKEVFGDIGAPRPPKNTNYTKHNKKPSKPMERRKPGSRLPPPRRGADHLGRPPRHPRHRASLHRHREVHPLAGLHHDPFRASEDHPRPAQCRLFTSTAVSAAKSTRAKIETKPTWKILEPEQRNHFSLPICTPARQHQEQGAGVRMKVKRISK